MCLTVVSPIFRVAIYFLAVTIIFFLPSSVFAEDQTAQTDALSEYLGEPSLPTAISQPDLPFALRPPGVPVVRPGRLEKTPALSEQTILLGALGKTIEQKEPVELPKLLPKPEPEPGIIYIMPFTAMMVPDEVYDGIFDQFVDTLIQQAGAPNQEFVILKQGLKAVNDEWLEVHKYITGEIFAYVQESGCCSTDIRTKVRVSYHKPHQPGPVFDITLPASTFFDHDQSTLEAERSKLVEKIVVTLTEKILPNFNNSMISKSLKHLDNNGV